METGELSDCAKNLTSAFSKNSKTKTQKENSAMKKRLVPCLINSVSDSGKITSKFLA
jgi:hypothetical protein